MKVNGKITLSPPDRLAKDEYYDEKTEVFWTIDINPKAREFPIQFKGVDTNGDVRWRRPNWPPSNNMKEAMKERLEELD